MVVGVIAAVIVAVVVAGCYGYVRYVLELLGEVCILVGDARGKKLVGCLK